MAMRRLSKEQMIAEFKKVKAMGWIQSVRPLNVGGIGNTIDQLLGFPENNLPIADTAQWELKSHRQRSASLITLLHMEPQPRSAYIVPRLLIPFYGWPDKKHPEGLCFHQTLRATQFTDRGFKIEIDADLQRVAVVFHAEKVESHHQGWLQTVDNRIGLGPLEPQPYWDLQQLSLNISTKMLNTFFVSTDTRRTGEGEMFKIESIMILQGFSFELFLQALETGVARVDFDSTFYHNHGTKYRIYDRDLPALYRYVDTVA